MLCVHQTSCNLVGFLHYLRLQSQATRAGVRVAPQHKEPNSMQVSLSGLPQALYKGLEELARQFAIELELHINEAPYARSFMLSDCELARHELSALRALPTDACLQILQRREHSAACTFCLPYT